jgi:hypothetical protein
MVAGGLVVTIPCPFGSCGGNIIREAVPDPVGGEPPFVNRCTMCSREVGEGRMQDLTRQALQRQETAAIKARTPVRAEVVKVAPTGAKPRNGWPMDRQARSRELRKIGADIFEYTLTHRLTETCQHFGISPMAWYNNRAEWEAAYRCQPAPPDPLEVLQKVARLLKDAGIEIKEDTP